MWQSIKAKLVLLGSASWPYIRTFITIALTAGGQFGMALAKEVVATQEATGLSGTEKKAAAIAAVKSGLDNAGYDLSMRVIKLLIENAVVAMKEG